MSENTEKIDTETYLDIEGLLNRDIPYIITTCSNFYLTNEKTRRELTDSNPKFIPTGYLLILRQAPGFWTTHALAFHELSPLDTLSLTQEALKNYPLKQAGKELMKRAEDSSTTKQGIWGIVAVGITPSGLTLPPLLFCPEGFTCQEAEQIYQKAEGMKALASLGESINKLHKSI